MKIDFDHQGRVTILRPHGDIRVGEGDVALRKSFESHLEEGQRLFVLNLKGVRFIDSAGLGELVASLKRVREKEGDLKLAEVNKRVSDALVVTQLVKILDVYATESEAVSAFV